MIRLNLSAVLLAIVLLFSALPPGMAATPAAELLLAGRMDEAIGALRNQVKNLPNDAASYSLLARAYLTLQRWDDAIAAGQKAVALEPGNSEYHLWLGRAYGEKADHSSWATALGLARKTRDEFERAVALNSRNAAARSDLAEYYIEAPSFLGGNKDKALAEAEALRNLGHAPAAHWIHAKIAENNKDYLRAEQELRRGIEASHQDPSTMLDLASFYRRRGRLNDAEALVSQAVQAAATTQHSRILYNGAELLYRAGRNFSGALEMLRNYISSSHYSEEAPLFRAYYLMGAIQEKMGNKSAAAEQYRAALALASNFEPARSALKRVQ
jgi:tetratricopeptide (TPR) repeat protein